MKWVGATAGLALALGVAGSAAASPHRLLYVVNATGHPFHMTLDSEPSSPEMAHLMGALRPAEPGAHVLKGEVVGEPASTTTLNLTEADLVFARDLGFWCVVVGRRPNAELAFLSATPPQCANLIRDMASGLPGK